MNQISFAKLETGMDMPHLLDIQTRAFESLLQLDAAQQEREDVGLERVFKDLFPITDVHENFSLEFVRYSLGEPKYTVAECIERDMTYSAPLKATLVVDAPSIAAPIDHDSTADEWLANPAARQLILDRFGKDGEFQGFLGNAELLKVIGNFPMDRFINFGTGFTYPDMLDMLEELNG